VPDFQKIIESITPNTESGLKWLTAFLTLVPMIIFGSWFVLPLLPNVAVKLPPSLTYSGVTLLALLVLQVLYASLDVLQTRDPRDNRWAATFQARWPSRHLQDRFQVSKKEATYYWFQIFNAAKSPSHPLHEYRSRALQRGFSCRLIYILIVFCRWASLAGVFWLVCEVAIIAIQRHLGHPLSEYHASVALRIVFTVLVGGIAWVLCRHYQPTKVQPSGPWYLYNEVNDIMISWLDEQFADVEELKAYVRRLSDEKAPQDEEREEPDA